MTTTFPVDNRNILDECDSVTGWTATDGPSLFTAAPAPVESTGYLGMQVSNATEDAYTAITSDDYSQGGTLSIWMQERAALDTTANVGFGIQIGDGTDRVAFAVGSDTVTAFRHEEGPVKWACFLLDPANLPADSVVLAGTLANLTLTAITQVGVYFSTVVKSVGGTDNCFWDIIRWADPGDDVVMQGGTTAGAAGNGSEAAAVDRSIGNQQGYGVIRELAAGVYGIQGNLTIGNSASATDQYWEETNVTYAWEARSLSDRNYYRFNFVGRTGQTSSVIFTASTLTCPSGADLRIDANGADLDVVTMDACTFIGVGVGIIGSDDTGDDWQGCTYVDCAALEVQGCDHRNSTFSDGRVCALIESQTEANYGDTATAGSFDGGTGYANNDTITLSNGAVITVNTQVGGAVTLFTVTTSEGFPAYPGQTLTQTATSGTGTGFQLWPRSTNLAEGGSMYYDLNVDPDGEIDGCSFTKGTDDTHAIVFGPNIPTTITLRDLTYTGYSGSDNVASSTLHFLDTTGTITVNIVGGDTPSVKTEGATIVINNSVDVIVDGLAEGTQVRVTADETVGTITQGFLLGRGQADSTGTYQFSLNYEAAFGAGLDVIVSARNQNYPLGAFTDDNGTYTDITTGINQTYMPRVASIDKLVSSTATTSHVVPLPAAQVGDLYVMLISTDNAASVTTPTGWTSRSDTAGTLVRHVGLFRTVDGTESTTVSVTTGASVVAVFHVFRVTNWDGNTTIDANNVAIGTAVTGTGSSIDPPNVFWSSFNAQSMVVQALAYGDDEVAVTRHAGTDAGAEPVYRQRSDNTASGANASTSLATSIRRLFSPNVGSVYVTPDDDWTIASSQEYIAQNYAIKGEFEDQPVFPASPVANQDGFIFGHPEQFSGARVNLTTSGSYTGGSPVWQYWNGSSWASLTTTFDGTAAFDNFGENSVKWDIPNDWATRTILTKGPFYYIRLFIPTGVTVSTRPIMEAMQVKATRYLPFEVSRTITSSGLTVTAQQTVDNISDLSEKIQL